MSAYVVCIRSNTKDPSGLERYAAIARGAPTSKIELVASTKLSPGFQVLEGPETDAVVIMRFPKMSDALEWYNSDAYQKALPHRLEVADYRTFLLEGP
jgi:uncharacterized protein (DUF1330 family)